MKPFDRLRKAVQRSLEIRRWFFLNLTRKFDRNDLIPMTTFIRILDGMVADPRALINSHELYAGEPNLN